jgi:hypothetical protein
MHNEIIKCLERSLDIARDAANLEKARRIFEDSMSNILGDVNDYYLLISILDKLNISIKCDEIIIPADSNTNRSEKKLFKGFLMICYNGEILFHHAYAGTSTDVTTHCEYNQSIIPSNISRYSVLDNFLLTVVTDYKSTMWHTDLRNAAVLSNYPQITGLEHAIPRRDPVDVIKPIIGAVPTRTTAGHSRHVPPRLF